MFLLISNMYPSIEYPNYGVFVKNQFEELDQRFTAKKITLNKYSNFFKKALKYNFYFMKVFFGIILGKERFVYVHYAGINAIPILLALLIKKKKLIVNVHGSDVIPESRIGKRTNFLTKFLLKKSDLIIVPSEYFKKLVQKKYQVNNIKISPSAGINTSLFLPNSKSAPKKQELVVGYVGRLDVGKGWELLVQAFAEFAKEYPSKLIIVGNGQDSDACDKLVDELNINKMTTHFPLVPQSELPNMYNRFDVLVFPSYREGESLGLVGIEAMACGVPVIGSNFGGISTYVSDGENGYLFEPKNISDLKNKLILFYQLSEKRKADMISTALHTAKAYDSKKVNCELLDLLADKFDIR